MSDGNSTNYSRISNFYNDWKEFFSKPLYSFVGVFYVSGLKTHKIYPLNSFLKECIFVLYF